LVFQHARARLWDVGVLLIEPQAEIGSKKDIVISSGIHGNETAPIEIVNRLIIEIFRGETIVKNRILFIIGNPVAMCAGERFLEENLNRLFCGKFKSVAHTYEGKRAAKLEECVAKFFTNGAGPRYHYDLHTAIRGSKFEKFAVYPHRENKDWDKGQLEFLQASGINTILFGHAPSGTFSYYSSHTFGAHAFTIELGKVMPFGQNDMGRFEAVSNNLRCLIQGQEVSAVGFDNHNFNLFEVLTDLKKTSDSFKLHVAGDAKNFTTFPVGTVLTEDGDEKYITSQEGESIVFPNLKVKNGQRAGLIVIPTEI
jgi:succinylglutamate desuccinylase